MPISLIAIWEEDQEFFGGWINSGELRRFWVPQCVGWIYSLVTDPRCRSCLHDDGQRFGFKRHDARGATGGGYSLGVAPLLLVGVFSEVYKRLFLALGYLLLVQADFGCSDLEDFVIKELICL